MGRPAKPKQIKIIEGTFRKDRDPEGVPEGKFIDKSPAPPEQLGKYGKNLWKKLIKHLINMGVMTETDLALFEQFCMNYDIYRKCLNVMNEKGIEEYLKRETKDALAIKTLHAASDKMISLSARFGLTPIDRVKFGVMPLKKKSKAIIEQEMRDKEMEEMIN
jgi:P27 family predicted phage terminase small subunit